MTTQNRYSVKPNEHGYQVFDAMSNTFCIATWTTLEATAQRWATTLNERYKVFIEHSRFATKLINKECVQ